MDIEFRNIAQRLRTGGLNKNEAALAIHLWQRSRGIDVADVPRAVAIARFRRNQTAKAAQKEEADMNREKLAQILRDVSSQSPEARIIRALLEDDTPGHADTPDAVRRMNGLEWQLSKVTCERDQLAAQVDSLRGQVCRYVEEAVRWKEALESAYRAWDEVEEAINPDDGAHRS